LNAKKPPRFAEWLLSRVYADKKDNTAIGDFEEVYHHVARESGSFRAWGWYWLQIVVSLKPYLSWKISWSLNMLGNYYKIALRNIKKDKGATFINVSGLAVGMACCIIIFLWVQNELSYDRFHANAKNIYRVIEELRYTDGKKLYYSTPPDFLGLGLKNEFPEIVESARFRPGGRILVQHGEKRFYEEGVAIADPSFLGMFSFKLIHGDLATALTDPASVILSIRSAEKYFGSENPLGKVLSFGNSEDFHVTGVMENVPQNSHLRFDFLVPFKEGRRMGIPAKDVLLYYTYLQLDKSASLTETNAKIYDSYKKFDSYSPVTIKLFLQPLTDIHLHSFFARDLPGHGDITYVRFFTIIAIFILFIACINFMNLATAQSGRRAKEVGVRKVLGCFRWDLVRQFYIESIVLCTIALVLALCMVIGVLPLFNQLFAKNLTLNIAGNWQGFFGIVGITLITALIAGSYPALLLSGFQPVKVLKSSFKSERSAVLLRRILVIFQFTISIALIIGSLIISRQLAFMRDKKLGYNKEHVIYVSIQNELAAKLNSIKQELLLHPDVSSVSAVSELPTSIERGTDANYWQGKGEDDNILFRLMSVDFTAKDVFQFNMANGRFFSPDYQTDISEGFVINQAAAKAMNMDSPVGQELQMYRWRGQIVGVVEDFHFRSLQQHIEPLVFRIYPEWHNYLCMKLKSVHLPQTLSLLEDLWKKVYPNFPFEYSFLDVQYESLYKAEQQLGIIFNIFTIFAILISCLGLFGLASFLAEQRTKEIGIRKVLGASVLRIVGMQMRFFVKWVFIASLFAWPLAYLSLQNWLRGFAYRTNVGIILFIIPTLLIAIITILTVCYQTIKAAGVNPIDTLKYE